MITISGITISNPSGDLNSVHFEIYNRLSLNTLTIPYTGQSVIIYNEPNNGAYDLTLVDGTATDICESSITVTAQTTGFDSNVFDILFDGDNNRYVCVGWFTRYSGHTTYDGVDYNHIISLNSDGNISSGFNIGSGFDNSVYSIIKDGTQYVVGGLSSIYNGNSVAIIIRLNADGTIDNTFNSGTGFGGTTTIIEDIIKDSGSKYVVCGTFTTYNGTSANNIVRLNLDGTIDNTFDSGTGFTRSIIQDSNGKYVIGGDFTSYSGVTANRIIRLNDDGTIDNTFSYGTGFNGAVQPECIIQDTNGKYVIGGAFSTYSGISSSRIVRLNSNGTIDNTFNIGTGFNSNVQSIIQDSNGKYVIGGYFTTYNGTPSNRIIRLNNDGSIDNTFNIGTGFDNAVFAIIQDGSYYVMGGYFLHYNGRLRKRIVKLNLDGSLYEDF